MNQIQSHLVQGSFSLPLPYLIQRPKYKKGWGVFFGNEIGRLSQGITGRNEGTDTSTFIDKAKIPNQRWKDIAHSKIVCNVRPRKEEVNRTRLSFGGQNLDVPMNFRTPTTSLLTIKLLLNSVISTPDAHFMTIHIKYFYLNTYSAGTTKVPPHEVELFPRLYY